MSILKPPPQAELDRIKRRLSRLSAAERERVLARMNAIPDFDAMPFDRTIRSFDKAIAAVRKERE